ncbi:MAG: phage tail tube protein, partial [Thaumarchaeota archaeon]|nr:phage tail tube protein [Nitrososphaerota archaeon]
MPTAQKMINRKDIIKHPQYAVEGHTPADYADTVNNARFVCPGSNSSITKENNPTFINNEFGGTVDRQGIHKVRDTNTLTYKARLHASTLILLEWATNLPDGKDTPAESRTFLDSYRDTEGNEVFRVFKGCKPTSITVSVSKEDALMVEIQMSCKEYYETQTLTDAKVTGASVWDAEVTTAPLRFKDVGSFQYNTDGKPAGGTELSYRAFSVTTTWGLLTQDSNASETDVFIDHGTRRITGSMEIFKNNQSLNEEARLGTQNVSFMELIDSETKDVQASKSLGQGGNTIKLSSKLPGA